MKIIQVISAEYPPREGIGSHVYSLSKWLVKNNHEVFVFVRDHKVKKVTVVINEGIVYYLVPVLNIPFISTFLYGIQLRKMMVQQRIENVDIIHYHSPLVTNFMLRAKKIIVTIHSTMRVDTKFIEPVSVNAILNKIMGRFLSPILETRLFNSADELIFVHEDTKYELMKYYNLKNSNTSYIPNGIDEDLFNDNKVKRKKQIIYVGRLSYRKGLPNLLRAINELKEEFINNDFKVIFCGEGKLKQYCESFVSINNLSEIITFSYKSQNELNVLLNQSKFLIMNSTYETGPRVVLEAIYTNTNIIATNVGLVRNISKEDYIEIEGFEVSSVKAALIKAFAKEESFNINKKYKEYYSNTRLSKLILDLYER